MYKPSLFWFSLLFTGFLIVLPFSSSSEDNDDGDFNSNSEESTQVEETFNSGKEFIKSTIAAVINEIKFSKLKSQHKKIDSIDYDGGDKIDSGSSFAITDSEKEKITWLAFHKVFGSIVDSLEKSILGEAIDILPHLTLSSPCLSTLYQLLSAMKQQKSWVFKMMDATGRPFSAGLMDGTITDFGSFDQCIGLHIPLVFNSVGGVDKMNSAYKPNEMKQIRGQYCMVQYNVFLPPRPKHLNLQTRIFNFTNTPIEGTFLEDISNLIHVCYERVGRVGICMPSSCSKDDLEQIIDYSLKDVHMHANVSHCEVERNFQFDGLQIIILTVFGCLSFFTLLGTMFDIISSRTIELSDSVEKVKIRSFSAVRSDQLFYSFLISFSIPRNLSMLLDTRTRKGSLDAINGIRVISMSWIVYTHTYLIPIKETFAFARSYIFAVESFLFQFILNGWVLVDTFFCIGALLAIYTTLGSLHRSGRINVLEMILNRFIRFSPSVWFTLALLFLIPAIGSGPLWSEYFDYQLDKCNNYWWGTVFFINNWFPEAKICMLHTWYIAADMQLYLVCILSLIVFYKYGSKALWLPYGLIFISMITVFSFTYFQSAAPTVIYNSPSEVITDGAALSIYTPTYIHLGPYCVGLIAGFLIYYKRNMVIPFSICLTCWILSISGLVTILFYTYTWNIGNEWTPLSAGFYATFHRTCWSICIAWIIFACVTDNGGMINTFLSWKGFVPLAKLSFMIYLLHFPILWWRYAYLRERLAFGHYTMLCEFIVNFTLSSFAALLAHLVVEAPASHLYKLFIQKHLEWSRMKITRKESKQAPNPDTLIAFKS
ncbi:nose resistant to fluoxetine protein 6-like [Panonychus citri]|uniref:nose resistant to fluoxetine protein 6-like n=1 Tax=Panonychus citri TaxID=50023 RepID=UPI00230801CE|nr:nose resistant to fluoxetine protein 6-like [Panonychus citri]XP_053205565.1 nose resistant to fluoxetine protein 6-like [Panonychus citri]XP_053205566.1 nose resistant to fluoxetine protein 6-like [Panonychus citri]